jgi:predicted amidohydrolase
MPKIAVLQMCSGIDPEANFASIAQAASEAAREGAEVLFTPEMSLLIDRNRGRARETISGTHYNQYHDRFCALAEGNNIDLALGSMPVLLADGMLANRSYYFRADGKGAGYYDKIHMFDVELSTGETWRESAAYKPGEHIFIDSSTPLLKLGFTVCYDLRFPALFGVLGDEQCNAIAVPAAFTKPTGAAHWHILLRARAIEASAFVIAAAQVGHHEDGRETYGHSLVVDPWGDVLLDMGGEATGLGFCDIDLRRIAEVRAQVPSLANRRAIPT